MKPIKRLLVNRETGGCHQAEEFPGCSFSVSPWWRGEPNAPERPILLSRLLLTLKSEFVPEPFRRGALLHFRCGRSLSRRRLYSFLCSLGPASGFQRSHPLRLNRLQRRYALPVSSCSRRALASSVTSSARSWAWLLST